VRAEWKFTLDAAKHEALVAVELYNQPTRPRRLEGFFVHMHMAFLYLFIARYQRDKLNYHYKRPNGRYEKVDGERKTWDLSRFARERWSANEPVRRNLELTIALRHKIEHRNAEAAAVATAGYAQALLLNFENELTETFGLDHTLGDDLRFPVFVGTFTRDGAARMAAAQLGLSTKTTRFLADFQADLDPITGMITSVALRQSATCEVGAIGSMLASEFHRIPMAHDDTLTFLIKSRPVTPWSLSFDPVSGVGHRHVPVESRLGELASGM